MDFIKLFKSQMELNGIVISEEIISDGELHRFHIAGDSASSLNGWYVLYNDSVPSGAYGCWKRGISKTWCLKDRNSMTSEEWAQYIKRVEVTKATQTQAKADVQAKARKLAKIIWYEAQPAQDNHPYLVKKQVCSYGLRVDSDHRLIIPLFDVGKQLNSLQFITSDGEKRFLPGGAISGGYFPIGKMENPTARLYIGEGYATCMTIYQATDCAVACAFNCGNLLYVTQSLREKFPQAEIVVAADNDIYTDGNPGLSKAQEVTKLFGVKLVYPDFTNINVKGKATDFNDLQLLVGVEEVKRQLLQSQQQNDRKSDGIIYRRFSEIESKPINWLWKFRIAKGKPTIFAGNPGKGKSQTTVSIASIVTTGGQWPVDHTYCDRGSVIFLSTEDDAADTIRPRLEAAGADLTNVFILDAVTSKSNGPGACIRQFNLKADLDRLSDLLIKLKNVALIVIDPISAYLGDTDSHKNSDVRALLSPLSDLAAKHEVAIIGVSHLNKGGSNEALMRVTGSLAFVAAARAAFLITPDNDDDTKRLFLPIKNNIATDKTGLAFTLQSYQLEKGIETSRVVWSDEVVLKSADEVIALQGGDEEKSKVEEAEEFLFDLLRNGSMLFTEIIQLAESEKISEKTLRRAKKKIGVQTKREGFGKGSKQYWYFNVKADGSPILGQNPHTNP